MRVGNLNKSKFSINFVSEQTPAYSLPLRPETQAALWGLRVPVQGLRQPDEEGDWREGNRTERDVRYVNQFIETALVLDKAMVRI